MTSPEFLSPSQVADLLAISRDSVLRAVKRGDLEAVVYGRLVRIPRSSLDAFLAAHRSQPRSRRRLRSTA